MSAPRKSLPFAWIVGTAITVAWVAMMFSLVRAYTVKRPEPAWNANPFGTVRNVAKWRDLNEYMELTSNGQAVGAARSSVRKNPGMDSYRSEFLLAARLGKDIFSTTISLKAAADLDDKFHLLRFYAIGDLVVTRLTLAGQVLDNRELLIELGKSGKIQRYRMALQHPLAMADYMSPGLATQMPIRSGSRASIPIFDPFGSSAQGVVDIVIKGREPIKLGEHTRDAYRVETSFHDIRTTMWVDALGQPLKRELASGFALEKTTSATALSIAPEIEEPLAIPALEVSAFKNVPLTNDKEKSPGGVGGPFSLGW